MILHPALIMLGAGIIIPFVPQIFRKMMLIIVPIIVLFSSYQLQYGQQESFNFINNIELIYLKVDELSWVFVFILAIAAPIALPAHPADPKAGYPLQPGVCINQTFHPIYGYIPS